MGIDNLRSDIKLYSEIFKPISKKQAFDSNTTQPKKIIVALERLNELGEKLESGGDRLSILQEVHHEIQLIDEDLSDEDSLDIVRQSGSAHQQALNILNSVNEVMLSEFLNVSSEEKNQKLADPEFAKTINKLILNADQQKIRDSESGDRLFHRLCKSKSEETRKLALICLEAGFNVNQTNDNGNTGLYSLAEYQDVNLISKLMEKGADPIVSTKGKIPFLLAILSQVSMTLTNYITHLEKFNVDDLMLEFKLYFTTLMKLGNTEKLIHFLDLYFSKHDENNYIESLWSICEKECNISRSENKKSSLVNVISWLIYHTPKTSIINSSESINSIKRLTEIIIEREFSKPGDIQIINKLIDDQILPMLVLSDNKSATRHLQEISLISPEIHLSALPTHTSALLYEEIVKSVEEIPKAIFEKQLNLLDVLDNNILELTKINYPNIDALKNQLNVVPTLLKLREKIKDFTEKVKQIEKGTYTFSLADTELETFLFHHSENELAADFILLKEAALDGKYKKDLIPGRYIFGMMMDKILFLGSQDNGFNLSITTRAMIRALNKMENEQPTHPLKEEQEKMIKDLITSLKPILIRMIYRNNAKKDEFTKSILEDIKTMQIGDKILIDSGCYKHVTLILLTNTGPKTFNISHYNTGQNVAQWHYQWENSTKYQTHFDLLDVPSVSINDKEGWDIVYDSKNGAVDMNPTYNCLKDKLGKDGRIPKEAESEVEYETKQSSGTCATQCLMAMLRHQVMLMAKGTPEEKEALYKAVKFRMFEQYDKLHMPQADDVIRTNVAPVLKKLSMEMKFLDIANDETKCKTILRDITDTLKHYKREDLAQQILELNTSSAIARYSTLRAASKLLCNTWLANPDIIPTDEVRQNEALQLAFAKFEHKQIIMKNIEERFYVYGINKNFNAFCLEIFRVSTSTQFSEIAMKEA